VSISDRRWSLREIVCESQNNVGLFVRIGFGGEDSFETLLGFHFEGKFQFLSIWTYFLLIFRIVFGVF